jgi:CubicO group peptidase (beta-lactamase class C family)
MIRFALIFVMSLAVSSQASAVKWNNSSSSEDDSATGKINTYGGSGYIMETENPNFETLRWSLYRKIHYRPLNADRFHSIEGTNSYQFRKDLRDDKYIAKQMKISPLLSYLMYEDGKITIDEITPKERFGDMFSNTTMYHSMSMGKSITSYLVGHAICDGTIESINAKLDDWPVLEDTLYHNQELLNFLNMATGDKKHSANDQSSLSIQARMAKEFLGTKKSSSIYHYTNLNTNIVISYLLSKYGEQGFKDFLGDIFINKIKIQHEVQLNKTPNAKKHEKSLGHQFFATRYDYLRIAVSMLHDWQEDTCVGQYLKTIHSNRIPKNGAQGNRGRVGLPLSYGGFFHTGYKGMKNRPVMGMDGNGGQTILIDFERGRIIATLSVFDNMRFPKSAAFDFKEISYGKIKKGKSSSVTSMDVYKSAALGAETLKKENMLRREEAKKAKVFWDKHFDKIFVGDKAIGSVLLSENFEKRNKLSVQDYNKNWRIEEEDNGNSVYCNKIKDGWTDLNFGAKNWSDYSITFKMKFITDDRGKVETHFRMSKQGRHTTTIKQFGPKTMIEALDKFFSAELSATDWLDIKVTAAGSEIKTYINDEIATSSNNGFWERGSAMIAVSKNSKLCIDDIIVRKM